MTTWLKGGSLTTTLEDIRTCRCVTKHVPLPVRYIILGEEVLCPTAYYNLQSLMKLYAEFRGEPPGYVMKHFGTYVRDLAAVYWKTQ